MHFRQFGLHSSYVFNRMSEAELDGLVQLYVGHNDQIGPNAVRAMLFADGIKVCVQILLLSDVISHCLVHYIQARFLDK